MADMVAWLMSKTFSKKSGHHRTYSQTKTLISLGLVKPTEHWRECLYLAEAYQDAKPENLGRPTKESEDIRELFEEKLLSCLRRSGFVPQYKALPKNAVLDQLSAAWSEEFYRAKDRVSRHARIIANPSLLAEDRIDAPVARDSFEEVDSVFDQLDTLFFTKVSDCDKRENLHQKRVKDPTLLSTKNKRDN